LINETIIQDYTVNCVNGLNILTLPTRLVVYPNYKIFFQSNSSIITISNAQIFDYGVTGNNIKEFQLIMFFQSSPVCAILGIIPSR
jgi:hypothetical protein